MTRNISVNLPSELYVSVNGLASLCGVKMGTYVRTILEFATAQNVMIRENIGERIAWIEAVKNQNGPLPRIGYEVILPANYPDLAIAAEHPAPYKPGKAQKARRPSKN